MATVNKQAVAAAFGRAASGYTQHDDDVFQHQR